MKRPVLKIVFEDIINISLYAKHETGLIEAENLSLRGGLGGLMDRTFERLFCPWMREFDQEPNLQMLKCLRVAHGGWGC